MISAALRTALAAYRDEPSAENWTTLSQLPVGEIAVLDALRSVRPDFPDPLPLPVDGLIEDDRQFYQWPELPDPADVERAIAAYR